MKKLIAVLLAALMCASLLMACGSTTTETTASAAETTADGETTDSGDTEAEHDAGWPEETYHGVFIMYVANDNWADLDLVKDALNEMCLRDLNIDLTVEAMTLSTAATQVPLMLAGGEQVDVFNEYYAQTYYDQGYVIDILPYKEYIQDALDLLGEEDVMSGCLNGMLLALPGQLERTHRYGMGVRTDILNAVGYTEDDLVECDWDQISEIFAKVHEAYPDMTIMDGSYSTITPAVNYQDVDYLTDGYGVLDNYGQTLTVTNYYEGDNYKFKLNYVRQWSEAGYIPKDGATHTDGWESLVKAGNTFGGCCPMKPDSKQEKDDQCGYDMTILYFMEDMLLGYGGSGYSIGGTCGDPVQAARLLNYCFTSREFNDTINWGVEGVDWVEVEDNVADYPEGMDGTNQGYHNAYGWAYPNERVGHVWNGTPADMYTVTYPEAEKTSNKTLAYGFHFDNTDYQDTIAALDNIKNEYYYQLGSGVGDDEMLNDFNEKMYASGLQDIIDGKQAQLDAWCEENGISE